MANSCNKLMKEAIDVAVNEFRGIEFTYKLEDVLDSLSPNQKFSSNQLKGYLLKQGVSPNEIRASKMFEGFEGDNRAIPISDWRGIEGQQKFPKRSNELIYENITLGMKGEGNPSYKVNEFTTNSKPNLPTNLRHEMFPSEQYDEVSQLGWNRVHQDEINGKPTTVLNELQSDWLQAERQGAGVFESKAKELDKETADLLTNLAKLDTDNPEWPKLANELEDRLGPNVNIWHAIENPEEYIKHSGKVIADFPMKPEKFQQLMIVDALNEAWENGTKRVAIPIERDNELSGSKGVTKFYESLNKSILPDIRKRLEKQGLRVKVSKEDYINSSKYEEESYRIQNEIDDIDWGDPDAPDIEAALLEELDNLTDSTNRLHILEIEEVPNARVKWDVYGLLAILGLGGLASQSEAAEPISTTSGIAPRETNSMSETMRLEGQPNIFRLQDLATGRTQVSKARPKEKEILDYFSQKESKGDYNAKSSISSAYGKYQFLKDTLAEKARLHGMTVKEARTPQGQEELMRKVLKDYEARLRKFDLPVTKENLFVVHNLGETGGIRAIRGTYTPEDVERMRNNIPGTKAERNSLSKSEVVKEYYKMHKVTKGS